jgi:hypothetical protein
MSDRENLIKVFEYALNQEHTGKSFFENSIGRLGVGSAVTAFKRLVQEEERHIQFVQGIINGLKTNGNVDQQAIADVTLNSTDYFDDRAKSEFLEQCVVGSMVPDVTVFNVAWLIEKDIAEFYANAARQTEGSASNALAMLSDWEKGHEKFFREFRDKLTETYANMPWGG